MISCDRVTSHGKDYLSDSWFFVRFLGRHSFLDTGQGNGLENYETRELR